MTMLLAFLGRFKGFTLLAIEVTILLVLIGGSLLFSLATGVQSLIS
jgi:hypothetical protein